MKLLQSYVVPIKGLAVGKHEFEYLLDTAFFAQYEQSIIKQSEILVNIEVDRKEMLIVFDFSFSGFHNASCDRCLASVALPLNGSFSLIAKLTEKASKEFDEDVIFLDPELSEYDLSEHLYEFAHLSIPSSNLRDCDAEDYKYCDHNVLDKLDSVKEETTLQDDQSSDPWEQLKNIKFE